MPLDFPATPTDGQQVTLGTTRWQWSAAQGAWLMQSGNVGPQGPQGIQGPQGPQGADGAPGPTGGVTIEVSDTEPTLPADKSLWFKSNDGALWLRYPDPTGEKHWLQVNTTLLLPPQDGNEYVMVNGLWRLKSQTLNLDGLNQFGASALVPAGARAVKFAGSLMWLNSAAGLGASLRASLDGTNFLNGGSDYTSSGDYINYAGAVAGQAPGNAAQTLIAVSGTVANFPVKFIGQQQVTKLAGTNFSGHSYGASAQAGTHYQGFFQWFMTSATWAGATQIKAIQFGAHANTGTFSDSYVDLEWVY